MAVVLDKYEFCKGNNKGKYPWKDWANGQIWRIYHAQDFDVSITSMQRNLHCRATLLGTKVRTSVREVGCVVFQFLVDTTTNKEPGAGVHDGRR